MPSTTSGRWLVGISAGVVALVIVAIVVAFTLGSDDPDPLTPGSPEAAAQAFVIAINDGELDEAYGLLAPDLQESCDPTEFRRVVSNGVGSDMRVSLESVDYYDDRADVTVRVATFRGSPPFDFSESSYTTTFVMQQIDDAWRVHSAPWPFGGCPHPRPVPTATPTPSPTPVTT